MSDAAQFGPVADSVEEVVRRLIGELKRTRLAYEQSFTPRPRRKTSTPEQREEWFRQRAEVTIPLTERCRVLAEVLALVMGWPFDQADAYGTVQILLNVIARAGDEVVDMAALKSQVETRYARSQRDRAQREGGDDGGDG